MGPVGTLVAGVILDRKGNFYGWTEFGDAKFGNPAFKIMP